MPHEWTHEFWARVRASGGLPGPSNVVFIWGLATFVLTNLNMLRPKSKFDWKLQVDLDSYRTTAEGAVHRNAAALGSCRACKALGPSYVSDITSICLFPQLGGPFCSCPCGNAVLLGSIVESLTLISEVGQ